MSTGVRPGTSVLYVLTLWNSEKVCLEGGTLCRRLLSRMGIQSYQDLRAWKHARRLTAVTYRMTAKPPLSNDFGLRDQMQRSAVSVMSNIAEGFGRHRHREFLRFLSYSKGSAVELQSQLFVALDAGYIHQSTFDDAFCATEETIRLIAGLIRHLERRQPPDVSSR